MIEISLKFSSDGLICSILQFQPCTKPLLIDGMQVSISNLGYNTLGISFIYTCTLVCTVLLKGLPGRFQIFSRRPSSFNPQSRFPGHSAEPTEEGCIGKCPQHTSLGLADMGIEPRTSCMEGRNTYLYTTNPFQFISEQSERPQKLNSGQLLV